MGVKEPGQLEIWLTVGVGKTLARSYYRSYVEKVELEGKERVLDFGSGAGVPAWYLARRLLAGGGKVTCVDISRVWTEVARRTLRRSPNAEVLCGELGSLALREGTFDVVFVHFVLHDIPAPERGAIVAYLGRLLVSRGKLWVREPSDRGLAGDELRTLMRQGGLEELTFRPSSAPFVGTMFEGVYRRPGLY